MTRRPSAGNSAEFHQVLRVLAILIYFQPQASFQIKSMFRAPPMERPAPVSALSQVRQLSSICELIERVICHDRPKK